MQTASHSHLMNHVVRPEPVMVRGRGSYLWDESGRRYLDFIQGWAVNALGHAPAAVARALSQQAEVLLSASPAFHNVRELELTREIARQSSLERVFLCSSGAEATEGAIKLCRTWGRMHKNGAHEIITTENGFHGRTLATMAATGKAGWETMFPPGMPGFVKVPFGDADAVRRAVSPRTVAILVEPIQGEAGVILPPDGYLARLRSIADECGILLCLDEVQTGMGRTGVLFAHQHEGVRPDVMTLGKGLGGGVPLAALVAAEHAACFERGEQGGTFSGNPLTASAGLAVLREMVAPGFLAAVRERGEDLSAELTLLGRRHGFVEVRGRGLLVAVQLDRPRAEAVRDRAFALGLLVNAPRPDTLRFMPALNVTPSEIAEMLALLERALGPD